MGRAVLCVAALLSLRHAFVAPWVPRRVPRMARRFFGASAPASAVLDRAPSWEELTAAWRAEADEELRAFREALSKGHVASAMANVRVFDQDQEAAKRVTLYRDSASWCPYCHKAGGELGKLGC